MYVLGVQVIADIRGQYFRFVLRRTRKEWVRGHRVGEIGRSISPWIETKEEADSINELAVS